MKLWSEAQEDVRKVKPDREMARSMVKMIEVRMKELEPKDRKEFASLVVEDYYEIIKEAVTALMATDGYKTLSHDVLIGYLKEFFPQFSEYEISLADHLRQLRNKIAYKGFFVNPDFLERNEEKIKALALKLIAILRERLASE
ncbi:MAG: hypothetical protein HYX24_05085 [Candidatus Aenigmarchaeota archaeon]|nr:hypothetical protein [Candidatus Aenigmarchaeota archaeon]